MQNNCHVSPGINFLNYNIHAIIILYHYGSTIYVAKNKYDCDSFYRYNCFTGYYKHEC